MDSWITTYFTPTWLTFQCCPATCKALIPGLRRLPSFSEPPTNREDVPRNENTTPRIRLVIESCKIKKHRPISVARTGWRVDYHSWVRIKHHGEFPRLSSFVFMYILIKAMLSQVIQGKTWFRYPSLSFLFTTKWRYWDIWLVYHSREDTIFFTSISLVAVEHEMVQESQDGRYSFRFLTLGSSVNFSF